MEMRVEAYNVCIWRIVWLIGTTTFATCVQNTAFVGVDWEFVCPCSSAALHGCDVLAMLKLQALVLGSISRATTPLKTRSISVEDREANDAPRLPNADFCNLRELVWWILKILNVFIMAVTSITGMHSICLHNISPCLSWFFSLGLAIFAFLKLDVFSALQDVDSVSQNHSQDVIGERVLLKLNAVRE